MKKAFVLVALISLWCLNASATDPAYIQDITSSGTGTTLPVTITATAHNLLVAFVKAAAASQTITVADNVGGTWASSDTDVTAGVSTSGVWYCADAIGGSTIVTMTNGTSQSLRMDVLEYSGVSNTSPLDVHNYSTGDSTSAIAPNITTSVDNELIFCAQGNGGNSGVKSVGAPYTLRNSSGSYGTADKVQAAAGSVTGATFTMEYSNPWSAFTAAFKPTGGAAAKRRVVISD